MQGGHFHLARLHNRDEYPSFEFFFRITDSYQSFEYVTGTPSTDYVSDETPMHAYANVHLALEKMRVRALSSHRGSPLPPGPDQEVDPDPPRVLVLGPESSGKTTVCKILTNYVVRAGQGWTPMYVNTDPSEVCMCVVFSAFVAPCVGAYAGGK
jgi:polyribonucleotide 5'-hydroxyl-kinase